MTLQNKLALGGVQFGLNYGISNFSGQATENEIKLILKNSELNGINTIDTAISYGESELILGKIGIEPWKIITKLPAIPIDCMDISGWVLSETQKSLKRLGISQVHGLLLHQPTQLLEDFGGELYNSLLTMKHRGMAKKIGVSVYSPTELECIFNQYELDLVQVPFNILDRRLVSTGWAKRLNNAGVEIHTRSTFLQGLLLMQPSQRPAKFNRWHEYWEVWDRWLEHEGLTPLQACLRYVNNFSEINRVVVGVNSVKELNEILEAAKGKLGSLPQFKTLQDLRLINPTSWNQL